jgi:hypothetical protein
VVCAALERCAETPEVRELLPTVNNLCVVDQCHCGCASVDFARNSSEHPQPIADGIGITPSGDRVGIIIWGVNDAITGLEVYDMSASVSDLPLSDLQSIISWEEAADKTDL